MFRVAARVRSKSTPNSMVQIHSDVMDAFGAGTGPVTSPSMERFLPLEIYTAHI